MIDVVAQAVRLTVDVELLGAALETLGIIVGGLVVYQALRGFRRNDSRAMLFLGLGLLVLGPVHFGLSLLPGGVIVVALAIELLDVLGLALIFYSLTRA